MKFIGDGLIKFCIDLSKTKEDNKPRHFYDKIENILWILFSFFKKLNFPASVSYVCSLIDQSLTSFLVSGCLDSYNNNKIRVENAVV